MRKVDVQTPEMTELLAVAPLMDKIGEVIARQVEVLTPVSTVINGEFVETENFAQPGDFIVTNPGGEDYVLTEANFWTRYNASGRHGIYVPKGSIRVIPNPYNDDIEIDAPWGAPQFGEKDCYIAVSITSDINDISTDRYIIAADALAETYAFRSN